ncbi:hypothetical protein RN001_010531 [Aquatica leii]|uniref:Spindle assembly abnormal protein 6 N-terminal domain-containing protein n=1 Tax=Aquatica leii TaxID=1421715 RepID=A0AAN7SQD1_9COLE|nr:hypothetical protein RN001_010531 [Aquatica leii]
MTSSSSSCSLNWDRSDCSNVIYNNQHIIDIFNLNRSVTPKNISILITNQTNAIKIKLRDAVEYGFNYTALIDWAKFEFIRNEQCLDITYEEFQPQIIDLLNQTSLKQMQMRLDVTDTKCKLIFYEKSRLKSLIFLTIDLELTNQKEVIEELSDSIYQLQNFNKSLTTQLSTTKNQLFETESMLKTAVNKSSMIEKQFYKDLELILQTFLLRINATEVNISTELEKLTKRHQKLLGNLEVVKNDSRLKNESGARLLLNVQNLRIENEKQQRVINELKTEMDALKVGKTKIEEICEQLKIDSAAKEASLETLQKQMNELRRDMQDATLIIAQKTKTNDEIGKDLMEANRLLVNFNTQYDVLSNEIEELKERISCKDEVIKEQAVELDKLKRDYRNLCETNNSDEVNTVRLELNSSRQRIEELEKQYRDVVKVNGLLTKKLSNGELCDVRNINLPFHSKS